MSNKTMELREYQMTPANQGGMIFSIHADEAGKVRLLTYPSTWIDKKQTSHIEFLVKVALGRLKTTTRPGHFVVNEVPAVSYELEERNEPVTDMVVEKKTLLRPYQPDPFSSANIQDSMDAAYTRLVCGPKHPTLALMGRKSYLCLLGSLTPSDRRAGPKRFTDAGWQTLQYVGAAAILFSDAPSAREQFPVSDAVKRAIGRRKLGEWGILFICEDDPENPDLNGAVSPNV